VCVHEHFETKILPGVIYKVSPDSLDVTVLTIRTILCLVGDVGFEPTKPEGNGVTARPNTPTLAITHYMVLLKGIDPSFPP
jgi:hypothetical protein